MDTAFRSESITELRRILLRPLSFIRCVPTSSDTNTWQTARKSVYGSMKPSIAFPNMSDLSTQGLSESNGSLLSLGDVDELFLLTEYVEGSGYNLDLERLRDTN